MKVVLQTPAALVVHDGRWKTVLMGFLFIVAGGGAIALRVEHPEGWTGNGGARLVYLVGGTFAAVGITLLALSADRRLVFDRPAKVARMVVQRLAHRRVTEYPFADVADVVLARSAGAAPSRGAATMGSAQADCYRIMFLMTDGSRVPWTPYSTNDLGALATTADAVRRFGGWAADAGSTPSAEKPAPAITHGVATNWALFAFFLAIFISVGIGIFSLEVYRLVTWRPVPATVLSRDIRTVRGSKGSTYAPVVGYSYAYEGVAYQGSVVTPVNRTASLKWARGLRNRFTPGTVATAYVDPGRPSRAFLVREVSLAPLVFIFFPLAMGALVVWIVRVQRRQVVLADAHHVPVVAE